MTLLLSHASSEEIAQNNENDDDDDDQPDDTADRRLRNYASYHCFLLEMNDAVMGSRFSPSRRYGPCDRALTALAVPLSKCPLSTVV